MKNKTRIISLSCILIIAIMVFGACAANTETNTDPVTDNGADTESDTVVTEADKQGGVFVIAGVALPTLDPNKTTMGEMNFLTANVFEGLYELDGTYNPVPALATDVMISEDGKTYIFSLREGVKFHDGSDMTSEDVVASFQYWLEYNSAAGNLKETVVDYGANGDFEFSITLKEPYGPLLAQIANDNAKLCIFPKESLENVSAETGLDMPIGTGPYKITEWIPDQHLLLDKFDSYTPFNEVPSSGYAGLKVAYVDQIDYKFIGDTASIIAGIQTDAIDYGGEVPADQAKALESNEKINIVNGNFDTEIIFCFNCGAKPFDDKNARLAAVHCMNLEDLAIAARGNNPTYWQLERSFMGKASTWYVPNAGAGVYNNQDFSKAKEYLEAANYDGTPVKILLTSDNLEYAAICQVLATQLEEGGFTVEIESYDRATTNEKRYNKDAWSLYLSDWYIYYYDPMVFSTWVSRNGWISNWDDEDALITEEIFQRLQVATDFDERYQIYKEWQDEFYRTVPYYKGYEYRTVFAFNPRVQNYWPDENERFSRYMGYNIWLKKK